MIKLESKSFERRSLGRGQEEERNRRGKRRGRGREEGRKRRGKVFVFGFRV